MNQSVFFEALGWSLIDSLWQAGAIWIIYIIATGNGNRHSAGKRYTLALAGILVSALLFFCSILINTFTIAAGGKVFSFAHFMEQQAESLFVSYSETGSIVPVLSYIYLPALLFFVLRTTLQLVFQRSGYRKKLLPAGDEILSAVRDIATRFGVVRKTAVWLSEKVESPLTIGFWKPVILLPVALLSHLSYRQIEAVIAHELFHIQRNDYLLNIFLTLSETVLFFNPFVRLLAAIVKKERENNCDDLVIAAGFDPWEYSEALYKLGRFRHQGRFALAATGPGQEYLLQRIRRIMKRKNPQPSLLKPFLAFFLCLIVAGFASQQKKHVPVLPDDVTKAVYKPVVYYSFEKKVTVSEPVVVRKQVTKNSKPVKKIEAVIPPVAPDTPPPIDIEVPGDEEVVMTFVASPGIIEFTMIDPVEPGAPDVVCESPQPYIPKSSFYFTEIDTVAGKKVVSL